MSVLFLNRCKAMESLDQMPIDFIQAYAEGNLSAFTSQWASILRYVESNIADVELLQKTTAVATKIKAINSHFMTVEKSTGKAQLEMETFVVDQSKSSLLETLHHGNYDNSFCKSSRFTPYSSMRPRAIEEKQEPLCHWFLSNLSYPYPTAVDKTMFTAQTGMNEKQLMAWFTNHRRRSGWTDALQKYANGNKDQMRQLVAPILASAPGDLHKFDAKLVATIHAVRTFLNQRLEGPVKPTPAQQSLQRTPCKSTPFKDSGFIHEVSVNQKSDSGFSSSQQQTNPNTLTTNPSPGIYHTVTTYPNLSPVSTSAQSDDSWIYATPPPAYYNLSNNNLPTHHQHQQQHFRPTARNISNSSVFSDLSLGYFDSTISSPASTMSGLTTNSPLYDFSQHQYSQQISPHGQLQQVPQSSALLNLALDPYNTSAYGVNENNDKSLLLSSFMNDLDSVNCISNQPYQIQQPLQQPLQGPLLDTLDLF